MRSSLVDESYSHRALIHKVRVRRNGTRIERKSCAPCIVNRHRVNPIFPVPFDLRLHPSTFPSTSFSRSLSPFFYFSSLPAPDLPFKSLATGGSRYTRTGFHIRKVLGFWNWNQTSGSPDYGRGWRGIAPFEGDSAGPRRMGPAFYPTGPKVAPVNLVQSPYFDSGGHAALNFAGSFAPRRPFYSRLPRALLSRSGSLSRFISKTRITLVRRI